MKYWRTCSPTGIEQVCYLLEGEAHVEVRDAGIPFDPTGAPEHIPAKTLAEAQPGGLGLLLIRRCSDWMSYRREGGRNHFVFGARWPKL